MTEIHRNGIAPFRFFTPFPHQLSQNISEGQWVRKPFAPAFGFKNTHLFPQRGKRCSVSGSALLSSGEEPCPLRLQTVFSTQKPSQKRSADFAGAKVACFPNPLS